VTSAREAAPTSLKAQLTEWARGAVPAIAGAVTFTGWVGVLGAAVVWMRFSTAGIPADQAVHDLPLGEMLVTGAVSLILYLVLGLVGVLVVYLLQGIVVSQVIGDENSGSPSARLQGELTLALARLKALEEEIAKLKGSAPAAGSPEANRLEGLKAEAVALAARSDTLAKGVYAAESVNVKAPERGNQWGLMLLVAAELVLVMLRTDISALGKVLIGLAAGGLGVTIVISAFKGPDDEVLQERAEARANQRLVPEPEIYIRLAAGAAIAALTIILVAVRPWTFAPVLVAIVLAFANLAVGRLHPQRFLWYGLSIFASVGLFGAVLTYSRDQNAPSAQPAAVLLKNGCAVRGLWIGEGSERVFMVRLGTANEKSEGNGPIETSGDGRVFWVLKADVTTESVGKLQRLAAALNESGRLRGELISLVAGGVLSEKRCESLAEREAKAAKEKQEDEGKQRNQKG
jgi:hypothetical protein